MKTSKEIIECQLLNDIIPLIKDSLLQVMLFNTITIYDYSAYKILNLLKQNLIKYHKEYLYDLYNFNKERVLLGLTTMQNNEMALIYFDKKGENNLVPYICWQFFK